MNHSGDMMTEHDIFKANYDRLRQARGLEHQEVARRIEYSPNHLSDVYRGKCLPSRKMIKALADVFDVPPEELLTPNPPRDSVEHLSTSRWLSDQPESVGGYVQIPILEAEVSMGGGSTVVSKHVKSHISYREDWARAKGNPKTMAAVRALGDSMAPTIPDHAQVLIDQSQKQLVDGGIFMVAYEDQVFLKRIRREGTEVYLISDLDGTRVKIEPENFFEVIGRALEFSKELV